MRQYLIKRLFYFLFTFFVVIIIAFAVTIASPVDPVDRMTTFASGTGEANQPVREIEKTRLRHRLGLDLPFFYFSLQSAAEPDTLYRVFPVADRNALQRLVRKYDNWHLVSDWYHSILAYQQSIRASTLPGQARIYLEEQAIRLRTESDIVRAKKLVATILSTGGKDATLLLPAAGQLAASLESLASSSPSWKRYFPVLRFHGQNRFHRWLFGDANGGGVLRGDFGESYISRQPVGSYIMDRLPWTVMFAFLSVLLAYAASIPLALRMARKPGGGFDRRMGIVLYFLFSLPIFWTATMLLMSLANPDVLPLFPASGVQPAEGYPDGAGFFRKAWLSLPYLILPTFCYGYVIAAFLTRLLRVSLREEMQRDYIRTAISKGLSNDVVRRKHALRNALLPAVTVFAEVFPLAIGGSVLIESIFTIPGMGLGLFQAVQGEDTPVMVAIFSLSGFVTMVGYLATDILYAFLDPRIRYQ